MSDLLSTFYVKYDQISVAVGVALMTAVCDANDFKKKKILTNNSHLDLHRTDTLRDVGQLYRTSDYRLQIANDDFHWCIECNIEIFNLRTHRLQSMLKSMDYVHNLPSDGNCNNFHRYDIHRNIESIKCTSNAL